MTSETVRTEPGPATVVVVGVDGSPASHQALLFAAEEARLRSGQLHIVAGHDTGAIAYGYAGGFDMGFEIGPLEEGLRRAAQALVQDAADLVAGLGFVPPVPVRTSVGQGRPSQVLLDAAHGAALLVVGARGAGAFTRLMMGSTSTEVVHHATLPVTVVPSGTGPDPTGPEPTGAGTTGPEATP